MAIVHVNGSESLDLPRELLEEAVARVLREERAGPAEISLTFVDDEAIRALNRQYLGRDRVTDVIAFGLAPASALGPDRDAGPDPGLKSNAAPAREPQASAARVAPADPDSPEEDAPGVRPPELLGDVYIGVEQAERQAESAAVPRDEELVRLAIHGTLHVLGHDHPEGEGRETSPLFRRQEALVQALMADADARTAS